MLLSQLLVLWIYLRYRSWDFLACAWPIIMINITASAGAFLFYNAPQAKKLGSIYQQCPCALPVVFCKQRNWKKAQGKNAQATQGKCGSWYKQFTRTCSPLSRIYAPCSNFEAASFPDFQFSFWRSFLFLVCVVF